MMGRSKFPGKPSKSINRKRISVLQLEEDEGADAASTTVVEEKCLVAAAVKPSNAKRNYDDDEDDACGGTGGGAGGGATAAGSSSTGVGGAGVGNGNGKTSGGGGHNGHSSSGGGTKNGAAVGGDAANDRTTTVKDNATKTTKDETSKQKAALNYSDSDDEDDEDDDEEEDDEDDEEDDEDDDDDDDDDDDEEDDESDDNARSVTASYRKQQTATGSGNGNGNAGSNSNSAIAWPRAGRKGQGKFKNLNLAKAEKMLPSSSKLKLLNCISPTTIATTTTTATSTLTTTPAIANESSSAKGNNDTPAAPPNSTTAAGNGNGSGGNSVNVNSVAEAAATAAAPAASNSDAAANGKKLETPAAAASALVSNASTTTTTTAGEASTAQMTGAAGGATQASAATMQANKPSDTMADSSLNEQAIEHNGPATATNPAGSTPPHVSHGGGGSSAASAVSMTAAATATTTTAAAVASPSASSTSSGAGGKQKKTVTFKNILETSDDKSAVKKFYNPDNHTPIVSIMKKECMNRALLSSRSGECIVRPSRLTEILKNNSNIDKLNALKFRSAGAGATSSSASSVFGSSLLRAFGAPVAHEELKMDSIAFRASAARDPDDSDADDHSNASESDSPDERETSGQSVAATEPAGAHKGDEETPNKALDSATAPAVAAEEDDDDDEQQMIVDKRFVLPKRSTRSSRVIKPNKRFIEDGIICKKSTSKTKPSAAAAAAASSSAPVVAASSTPAAGSTASTTSGGKKEQQNYFGLGDLKETPATKAVKETAESKASGFSLSSLSNFGSSKANSFILRQPRLQFDSLVERSAATSTSTAAALSPTGAAALAASLPKSLTQAISAAPALRGVSSIFSLPGPTGSLLSPTSNLGLPASTTSSCGVCTVPIAGKNLQQARKYDVPACEVCRKFISKLMKKSLAASASPSLKQLQLACKTGDGECSVNAHSKSHIKNFKKIYKERCTACWLKRCLQALQFPAGHKQRLSAALSATMLAQVEPKKGRDTMLAPGSDTAATEKLKELPGSGIFGTNRINANAGIKWKSALESVTAATTTTTLASGSAVDVLKLNLKSNPLAENNLTFGSSPLLRPAILEKSLFLKSLIEQQKEAEALASPEGSAPPDKRPADVVVPTKTLKTKRKEKQEKDKEATTCSSKTNTTTNAKQTTTVSETKTSSVGKTMPAEAEKLEVAQTAPAIVATTNATTTASTTTTPTSTTTVAAAACATTIVTASVVGADGKRQRIDLKGPRVKHVCRSASIVLGQPLAMFGEEGEEEEGAIAEGDAAAVASAAEAEPNKQRKPGDIVMDENENCASCKGTEQAQTAQPAQQKKKPAEDECVEPAPKAAKVVRGAAKEPPKANTRSSNTGNALVPLAPPRTLNGAAGAGAKKYMRQLNSNELTQQQQQLARRKEPANKPKLLISIDFWENYDPAEVCQTGFGLIVTETVAQRALCFLCGSTGVDPLIFCACCCEPYHQYCVMDEYNLKHSSLDDTMASLLDTSLAGAATGASGIVAHNNSVAGDYGQITQRLNWLCPRCTVCYTCNMSSGSKVRCQKCQKNYHSTCLGTSKRLLGADRPLICVNCLKCKSCATTKVSKFVGNLPMCTACFKLRKKGNYCPICQKCYDDNDFDLKMMECGDCKQWVHSKCEGLSDEQYNLLSTLPESIEFICKRCARRNEQSKQKAHEWRQAVIEEFKTSLLSVLKLLSKSRQACALLKLSPRKKVMQCNCNAGGQQLGKAQPKKALQFNGGDPLGSDGESQCSNDVYEFKDFKDKGRDEQYQKLATKCTCMKTLSGNGIYGGTSAGFSLVDIKKKIGQNKYVSLAEFNYDMNNVIQHANCDELIIVYKEILSEQFPWFQNETKACTDALEEDMFESCGYALSNHSQDGQEEFVHETQESPVVDLPDDIEEVLYSLKSRTDARHCLFCRKTGEGLSNDESRLLYCGHDCWVHTNCAMWSAEVFEEIDGSLQNVHSAVSRGRMIKCTGCGNRGATVGCNVKACGEHYHYPCARKLNCAFLTDKTVYCPEHAKEALREKNNVTIETNFEVARPVYVELDRRRKKLIEPTKVQFHIGSLEVKQLGAIFPRFSDSYEAIVPINFLCSRLYWSLKEPWKIVEYTVRTTIQNSYATYAALDTGRNFTVDHTNPNASLVQLGLAQISRWHGCLARGELGDLDGGELASMRSSTLNKLLPDYLGQQNSSSATDENTEEEPQTNADLLPPEIKDAIFEDLPHELLDGISMLDIFPKFMNYEDLGNDGKSEMFLNEQSKDGSSSAAAAGALCTTNMPISDEDTVNSSFSKQLELSNSWSSSALTLSQVEDVLLATTRCGAAQMKRSNKADLLKKGAPPQRAWAKLEGSCPSVAAAIKRRKLSKGLTEGVLLSLNQQQRPKKETVAVVAVARRQSQCAGEEQARTKQFTWSAAKRYIEPKGSASLEEGKIKLTQMDGVDDSVTEYRIISTDGPVKCDRCHCTYRTYDSFQRHLANCEALSTSESESEPGARSPETNNGTPLLGVATDNGDLNKLGQRAATAMSNAGGMPFLQAFPQGMTIGNLQPSLHGIPIANMQGLQGVQTIPNIQGLQNFQLQNLQPQLGGNFFISQPATSAADELQFLSNSLQGLTANLNGTYTLTPTTHGYGTAATMQPAPQQQQQQPQLIAVSTNPDGTQQIIHLPAATSNQLLQGHSGNAYQTLQTTSNDKKLVLPVAGKPLKTMATKAAQQANAAKNKLKAGQAVKPIQSKLQPAATLTQQSMQPITVLNANGTSTQLLNQNLLQQMQAQPQLLFQTGNGGGHQQQPIIMQQLGGSNGAGASQNIISFVTTDANSQNPQVQYLSIPTATTDYKAPQQAGPFITATTQNANQLMQGAFLQTDASGNLILTSAQPSTGGLQMLSATPIQQQPQVIGTLIQPQTLQLGGNVITTGGDQQQVIIGGGGTGLELMTAGNAGNGPQVILATQPMYYGLETIVQNTVMSSQQFVSTAMPGVLSQNASFSATTTQVFQASKIEPLVDIPAGYVVLNNVDATPSLVQSQQQQPNFISAANVMQQQQQQHMEMQSSSNDPQQQPTIYRIQTASDASSSTATTTITTSYPQQQQQQHQQHMSQQQQHQFLEPNVQIVTAKVPPVTQVKRNNSSHAAKSVPMASVTKVQPQVVNKVLPTTLAQQQKLNQQHKQQQQQQQTIYQQRNNTITISSAAANNNNQAIYQQQQHQQMYTTVTTASATMAAKPLQVTAMATTTAPAATITTTAAAARKTNLIRPIHKAEVKPKFNRQTSQQQVQQQQQQQFQAQQQQLQQQQIVVTKGAMLRAQSQPQQPQPQLQQPQVQQYQLNNNTSAAATSVATTTTTASISNKMLHYEQTIPNQQFQTVLLPATNQQQQQQQQQPQPAMLQQQQKQSTPQPQTVQLLMQNSNNMIMETIEITELPENFQQQVAGARVQYVPTNIVNPIQQNVQQYSTASSSSSSSASSVTTTVGSHHTGTTTTLVSRPTNRVLPMQQRQENGPTLGGSNNKVSTASNKTAQAVTSGLHINSSPNNNKCYSNEQKIYYEAEVKKDQQMLQFMQQQQSPQMAPTPAQQEHEQQVLLAQEEQQQQQNDFEKAQLEFNQNAMKCDLEAMQTETALTCQQMEIVTTNLQSYTGDCLLNGGNNSNKQPTFGADVAGNDGDNLERDPLEPTDNVGGATGDDEDDDEDGFSLKMPADDGEHEMSDSDEPAVKEKISKILDNLTNEECAESAASTATTLEVNRQNAAGGGWAMEVLTQMTENMSGSSGAAAPGAAQTEPALSDANYAELKKLEAKLSPQIAELNAEQAADPVNAESIDMAEITPVTRKHSPAPPSRQPEKISGPHLLYEIQSEDGFTYKSTSITEVWEKVFEAVQVARRAHGLMPLPEGPLADMSGVQMLGLKTNALKYLIEQLPGVEKCNKYTPKYHKRASPGCGPQLSGAVGLLGASTSALAAAAAALPLTGVPLDYGSDQDDLSENLYECVRCEPYASRSEYDMFSWLASRHRKQPIQVFVQPSDTELIPRRGTGSNLPMAMKYRTLKETYKDYVGVFRSHIHGRGLYCTKDIEAGEMVIEYAGELIRSTLTDKRERNYDSRGIGCYMFKIDDNLVVDATMRGNAARFINHSCEPNCYSKVVDILGHKHIIIFALRRIVQGEELTYDYKFPFEEEKIPCSCGSKKCRKYLN